jgi:putative membrane protein
MMEVLRNWRFQLLLTLLALLACGWLFVNGPDTLFLLTALLLAGGIYLTGLIRVWSSTGLGHGIPVWRAACFLAGMLILAFTLLGPMDELADGAFSMHMVQHMLLMKVIAPLLLLGEFSSLSLWAVGKGTAHQLAGAWNRSGPLRGTWRWLTHPWIAWTLFAMCLWIWHIPAFYQAALESEPVHGLEHLLFLGTSMLFWWYLLQDQRDQKVRYGGVVLYLFTTLLQESILGALLTFSSRSWYSLYNSPDLWGLSPLADQQLAGLIMWLPGGMLFMFLIVLYFGSWLQAIERSLPGQAPQLAQTGDGNE